MRLLDRFILYIRKNDLFSSKDKLFLAVSGGIDSVVLCELCKQANYDFEILHCNFQLRGEESERDENFVKQLGDKYKVKVEIKRFETEKFSQENKLSIQEAARVLRYEWFDELVQSSKFRVRSQETELPTPDSRLRTFLLTAHHADDNIETVLMNFFRGTGLHGLTGIPVSGPGILNYIRRPLLSFSKNELVDFAKDKGLEFVEDSSNLSSKYTRNFFRNEIIPAISKVYPEVKANLLDSIDRFKGIEKLYTLIVGGIKKKLIREKGNEWHIPIKQLMGYDNRALIYEIIADYGFNEKQIDEVIRLAESESGKYIDSPNSDHRIIKHRHWFIISPTNSVNSATIIIEQNNKQVIFDAGSLKLEDLQTSDFKPQTSNNIACLDAKEISFPLMLRKWKTGDYFYPLGMKKKKKLSRFFIDQKLSKTEKEKMWVIEMNKKVIWIVGKRIDERFKVTEKTRSVLKITYDPRV